MNKYQLQHELMKMSKKDLLTLCKYFGIKSTQNGGYCKKEELSWMLVGGSWKKLAGLKRHMRLSPTIEAQELKGKYAFLRAPSEDKSLYYRINRVVNQFLNESSFETAALGSVLLDSNQRRSAIWIRSLTVWVSNKSYYSLLSAAGITPSNTVKNAAIGPNRLTKFKKVNLYVVEYSMNHNYNGNQRDINSRVILRLLGTKNEYSIITNIEEGSDLKNTWGIEIVNGLFPYGKLLQLQHIDDSVEKRTDVIIFKHTIEHSPRDVIDLTT